MTPYSPFNKIYPYFVLTQAPVGLKVNERSSINEKVFELLIHIYGYLSYKILFSCRARRFILQIKSENSSVVLIFFSVLSVIQIQRAMSSYNLLGFPRNYYPRDHCDHHTNVKVLNHTSKRGGFNYEERFSKFGNCDWFQRRSQLMKVIFFSSLAQESTGILLSSVGAG